MIIPARLIVKLVEVIKWMNDWKPLAFRWLPDPYRLQDDACGCERCEERRGKGQPGERKYF